MPSSSLRRKGGQSKHCSVRREAVTGQAIHGRNELLAGDVIEVESEGRGARRPGTSGLMKAAARPM